MTGPAIVCAFGCWIAATSPFAGALFGIGLALTGAGCFLLARSLYPCRKR